MPSIFGQIEAVEKGIKACRTHIERIDRSLREKNLADNERLSFLDCQDRLRKQIKKHEKELTALQYENIKNELKDYGGSDPTKPIYLALKGVVFDVSTRREFYGKNAVYNRLVGRDSTNAVAKMSLHETDVSKAHDISDLSETQLKDLEQIFHQVYLAKYPIVGFMDYLLSVEEFAKQIKPQDEL
ncbi:Hypothetical predicted protein [Octopus vulgaris]|uniref:Cytochrome b5 heme-binding domain-containing protein n=1 Tax=Octopus vulgaris TaxID=6645 RepID=A0AA36BCA3_OCTVU|nr:Hypothetical predicted protein [Octopus vulgaris]